MLTFVFPEQKIPWEKLITYSMPFDYNYNFDE